MPSLKISWLKKERNRVQPISIAYSKETRNFVVLTAIGFFATTLAQPAQIGSLPLRLLLKNNLNAPASDLASFFAIAAIAWYLKPLAGILCDTVSLFGSRRRLYLLLSATLASFLWMCLGQVTPSYYLLLSLAAALNIVIVIASTVLGGLMVEIGQRNRITGQLISWKFAANNLAGLLVGPLGGYLASLPFIITAWTGAITLLPLALAGFIVLRSETTTKEKYLFASTLRQVSLVITNKGLLLATLFIFLVGLAPGFDTPLLYFQTDNLHFTAPFLGWLAFTRSITGLAGAASYGAACKHLSLKRLTIIGVLLHAIGSVLFLFYQSNTTALIVEGVYGFCYTVAQLPVFDLAARAAPKGSESMGLALIMSLWNVSNAASDILGSWLFSQYNFKFTSLVWLNTITTLCVLLFLRWVPSTFMTLTSTKESI